MIELTKPEFIYVLFLTAAGGFVLGIGIMVIVKFRVVSRSMKRLADRLRRSTGEEDET